MVGTPMRRGSITSLIVAAVLAVSAAPATAQPIEVGHIPECLELVPAAIAAPPGSPVSLEVRVLLDGVSTDQGQAIFDLVSQSYAPVGMPVVPSFEAVSFSGTDAQGLIDQAKAHFDGVRPAGVDVVYVLTSKNITAIGTDAVAGLADCIGGVAFPEHAFAVGEVLDPDSSNFGGLVLSDNLSAKVAAHEVGHLFGGHHHYANCVEGLLSELGSEISPCTLMFNDVGLASFNFGAVNSLVVRGHGEAYAG